MHQCGTNRLHCSFPLFSLPPPRNAIIAVSLTPPCTPLPRCQHSLLGPHVARQGPDQRSAPYHRAGGDVHSLGEGTAHRPNYPQTPWGRTNKPVDPCPRQSVLRGVMRTSVSEMEMGMCVTPSPPPTRTGFLCAVSLTRAVLCASPGRSSSISTSFSASRQLVRSTGSRLSGRSCSYVPMTPSLIFIALMGSLIPLPPRRTVQVRV